MQGKFLTRTAAALAMTGLLVVGAGACGKVSDKVGEKVGEKVAEKSLESAGGGDVDISDDGMSIKTKDGEYSSKATKDLPKGWPSDILAVADGFEIENVTESKTADGAMSIVSTKGKADPGELVDFYVDALESNDVEIAIQTKSGDGGMVNGTKGDTSYQVMIGSESDGQSTAMLSVTVSNEQTE
jgi:hypothetical protein